MATKTKVTKAAPKAAAAKSTPEKTTTAVKAAPKKSAKSLSHDEIARQAFMLWQERGGSEMENWLEAERRLH